MNVRKLILCIVFLATAFPVFALSPRMSHQAQDRLRAQYELFARLHPEPMLAKPLSRAPQEQAVGDTITMWVGDDSGVYTQLASTVRGVGDHVYIVVANNVWNRTMRQANVDAIIDAFEFHTIADPTIGIYQMDTGVFGDPPDIDSDPHIYLFYYNLTWAAGFFTPMDQMTEAEARRYGGHSNVKDMVYLSTTTDSPSGPFMLGTVAHEFQHMIHENYDPDEVLWVNEGCAQLACVLFGAPDAITDFQDAPTLSLAIWNGDWVDYIKVQLYFTYMTDKVGRDFPRALVQDRANSVDGIVNALAAVSAPRTFNEYFADWGVANILNNHHLDGGRYGYTLYNTFPTFRTVSVSRYPSSASGSLDSLANKYYKFRSMSSMDINFEGDLDADFRLHFLSTSATDTVVFTFPLDASGRATFHVNGILAARTNLFMTITNSDIFANGAFSYNTVTTDVSGQGDGSIRGELQVSPNPTTGPLEFRIPMQVGGEVTLRLYTPDGRLALAKSLGVFDAGSASTIADLSDLPAGSYLGRISGPEGYEALQEIILRK